MAQSTIYKTYFSDDSRWANYQKYQTTQYFSPPTVATTSSNTIGFEINSNQIEYDNYNISNISIQTEIETYKTQSSASVKLVKNAETQVQLPQLDLTKSVRHIETQVDEQDLPARTFPNRNINSVFRSRQQQDIEFLNPSDFELNGKMVLLSDKFEYQVPENLKTRMIKCIQVYEYKPSSVFRRLMRSLITDREAWLDNYNFSIIKKYPIIDACIDFMQGYFAEFTKKEAKTILSRMSSERRYTLKQMRLELQKQQEQQTQLKGEYNND